VLLLDRLELAHQVVEVAVRDRRLVEHVVAPAVVRERLHQLGVALDRRYRRVAANVLEICHSSI